MPSTCRFVSPPPPAFRPGGRRGERRRLHRTHPVDRAEALRGERADQRPGKDGGESGREAAGGHPEGDRGAEEERGGIGQTFPHRRPRPLPSGTHQSVVVFTSIH